MWNILMYIIHTSIRSLQIILKIYYYSLSKELITIKHHLFEFLSSFTSFRIILQWNFRKFPVFISRFFHPKIQTLNFGALLFCPLPSSANFHKKDSIFQSSPSLNSWLSTLAGFSLSAESHSMFPFILFCAGFGSTLTLFVCNNQLSPFLPKSSPYDIIPNSFS